MTWTFEKCKRHWDGRRKSNDYRSIASCGWQAPSEYMEWNECEKCFDLTLYRTVIVKVFPNKYVINCGGWWANKTRKRVQEWSGVRLANAWPRGKYIEDQFVMNGSWVPTSVYYPRMEVSLDGEPLKPVGATAYRVREGATKTFTDMAKRVRMHLMPRVMIGEFEGVEGKAWDGEGIYELMQQVDASIGGLFPRFMPTDELDPLFRARPRQVFGRTLGRTRHWYFGRDGEELSTRTAAQKLVTNIAAAKRYWMSQHNNRDFYEIVPKEFS